MPSVSTIISHFNNSNLQQRAQNVIPPVNQPRFQDTQSMDYNFPTPQLPVSAKNVPIDVFIIRKAAQTAISNTSQEMELSYSRKTLASAEENLKLLENSPVEFTHTLISIFNMFASLSVSKEIINL